MLSWHRCSNWTEPKVRIDIERIPRKNRPPKWRALIISIFDACLSSYRGPKFVPYIRFGRGSAHNYLNIYCRRYASFAQQVWSRVAQGALPARDVDKLS